MKVFIDLGKQICEEDEPQFAFYCTVHCRFESFLGEQVWSSKDDFEEAYRLQILSGIGIERYLSLIPESWGNEQ